MYRFVVAPQDEDTIVSGNRAEEYSRFPRHQHDSMYTYMYSSAHEYCRIHHVDAVGLIVPNYYIVYLPDNAHAERATRTDTTSTTTAASSLHRCASNNEFCITLIMMIIMIERNPRSLEK